MTPNYCQAANTFIFAEMRRYLPRELRDMIYAQLWDFRTLQATQLDMRNMMIDRPARLKPCICDDGASGTYLCARHQPVHHFAKPGFVGKEAAQEVIEAWHM